MSNFFIAYDFANADEDRYKEIQRTIASLGSAAIHLQYSTFYLQSGLSLEQIKTPLRQHIESGDKLLIVEASAASGSGHGVNWQQLLDNWSR